MMYKVGDKIRCTFAIGPHFTVGKVYEVIKGTISQDYPTVIDNSGNDVLIHDSKFKLVNEKEGNMQLPDTVIVKELKERYQDIKAIYRWMSKDNKLHTKVILKTGEAGATVLSHNDTNSVELSIVYALLKARGKAVRKVTRAFDRYKKQVEKDNK